MDKELYIVTGASAKLGECFIKSLQEKNQKIIGLSRKNTELNIPVFICDLLKEDEVENIFNQIDFSSYESFVLIHTVGKFKFEKGELNVIDNDGDGIDDEVFFTNVTTLKNTLKFLIPHTKGKSLKVCAFGSVSDKYSIPFWVSYRKAKNIMKQYLKDLSRDGEIKALVINVSTLDTGNENLLRPEADKTYWLKPQEVVDESLVELDHLHSYEEIDIVKNKPDFKDDYYLDHDALLEKWQKEMGSK